MGNRAFVRVSPHLISQALFDGEVEVIDSAGLDQSGALLLEIEGDQLPDAEADGLKPTVCCIITNLKREFRFEKI
jgi:hypothetical protein